MTDPNLTTDEVAALDTAMRGWARDLNIDTETVPEVIARIVEARVPTTLWLVVAQRQSCEDYRDWHEEEAWQTIERGYFASEEDARGWIERTEEAALSTAKGTYDMGRVQQLRQHDLQEDVREHKTKQRQTEYDTLRAAGVAPSFKRPADFKKKRCNILLFDERRWRRERDIRYLVEKIEPCEDAS